MPTQRPPAPLASLTAQLQASAKKDQEKLEAAIAQALKTQDPSAMFSQHFLFEQSDLFTTPEPPETKSQPLQPERGEEEEIKILVRTLPVRSTQLPGSLPQWAAGARVETIGPFLDKRTERQVFVDVIKIKKLIPLYVQGQPEPVLLFNASFQVKTVLTTVGNKATPELTRNFTVAPETIWILARLFDPTAPAGHYAGLRVKSGTIALNADPSLVGGKLTITTATTATCNFTLDPAQRFDNDPASPYGADARNATFKLPETFQFSFKGLTKTIVAVGESSWNVYGQANSFKYAGSQASVYNAVLSRLAIPVSTNTPEFDVQKCQSPFCTISGKTSIQQSWWAIPVAQINIAEPPEADGNGGLVVLCGPGLSAAWTNLQQNKASLPAPFIIGEPGRIGITDVKANATGAYQDFRLWQDEVNAYGSTLHLQYSNAFSFAYNTLAKGDELILAACNADLQTDRPVKVDGNAVTVQSKNSTLILSANQHKRVIGISDENILWDNKLPNDKIPKVRPIALALHNALFTVTPPNGMVLFGNATEDWTTLRSGKLYLYFGLFSYLPTLPDPYAANLGILEQQFRDVNSTTGAAGRRNSRVSAWLMGFVQWEQREEAPDKVGVSFHFAPLQKPLEIEKDRKPAGDTMQPATSGQKPFLPVFNTGSQPPTAPVAMMATAQRASFETLAMDDFALLDVSSKANQMGVAFSFNSNKLQQLVARQYKVDISNDGTAQVFPVQVTGLDVVAPGRNVQSFTVPQISWEPVLNTTPQQCLPGQQVPSSDNPDVMVPASPPFDPPIGWNYYQNDGFPTRLGNLSKKPVALSPIPLAKYLEQTYHNKEDGKTYAFFNLPFGMVALSFLDSNKPANEKANIRNVSPLFSGYVIGGIQLELTGGVSVNPGDGRLFEGFTFQLHNINDVAGVGAQYSNLAHSPDIIFNGEFANTSNMPPGRPAVPLERIGISGYGASAFSNWENKDALFAQTSQAFFNVAVGRTSREVVQVKSMVYPWGIRVVRTITLFRMGNGYVARVDSGWQAQSDGLFDFRYPVNDHITKKKITKLHPNPFNIHPGPVRGLYNIRNIREVPKAYNTNTNVVYLWREGVDGRPMADEPPKSKQVILQGVTFDCDVEIDNVVEGGTGNRVPSKGVHGYVQLAPPAAPIDATAFKGLMGYEKGTIGGPINCTIKVAGTSQRMRLDRFDVNASQDTNGAPVFAAAVRGAVVLPKDGSWTLVQHNRGTGEVTPMPEKLSVPLIAEGRLDPATNQFPEIGTILQRIAFPGDLLKQPDDSTINFGLLQNMNTQKVLFLTPAFKKGIESLMSKTPPLLADAYRLMKTNAIFPNIGDAEQNLGTAIQLLKGVDAAGAAKEAFFKPGVTDNLGKELYEILELKAKEEAGKLLDQGYKLIKAKGNEALDKVLKFDLPNFDFALVDIEDVLRIYVEYKAKSNPKHAPKDYIGKFDFDVNSFAADMADTWKGRMNNLAMVVDLGPLKRLMTIKGNFNSQKGKEVDYGGKPDGDSGNPSLPVPEIEFSDAVDAVIKILEILAALSTGKYGDALKKGLKVAMSNSANLWEYKFEATKDIALVRFPPEPNLYESPTTPLKLEASMSLGVFFNAALKVTSDPKQLLPTAGAFFKFHGGLQVMCVSLAAGTVYAVGSADLTLRADTSPLISLTMKFGFGAQITVGLPVIANVSVLFMVGVEVYVDSSQKVIVTAIMMFRGHAEILGGIVGVTITIEARGSIEKAGDDAPCNCKAQVTFGLDISVFMVINLSFSESWQETRQIA